MISPALPTLISENHVSTLLDALAEQAFCVLDDALPNTLIETLGNVARHRARQGQLRQAGTGKSGVTHPALRGDQIAWLEQADDDPVIQQYFALLAEIQCAVNRHLMMGLDSVETHFALYPAFSSGYATHLDQFRQPQGTLAHGIRALTFILYLNEDWPAEAGGALRLYLDEQATVPAAEARHLDIMPLGGRMVVFVSSRFWHQVLPATQARMSVTGWFRTR